MKFDLPLLKQTRDEKGNISSEECSLEIEIDTSVYSEERWEQNFPQLAAKESLFQYIERVQNNAASQRVQVSCMLKAVFCFIESSAIKDYKQFAQMFNLASEQYVTKLIQTMLDAFSLVIGGSSVKN